DELLRGLHPPAGKPAAGPPARDGRPILAAFAAARRLRRLQHAHRPHQQAVARVAAARPGRGQEEEQARCEDDGVGRNLSDLLVEDRDGVRTLTLNRPDALNAFNTPLYDACAAAFHEASARDDIACVVLTGRGRAFSAGQDLAEMAGIDPNASGRADDPG